MDARHCIAFSVTMDRKASATARASRSNKIA
jgi:hypothetical protein